MSVPGYEKRKTNLRFPQELLSVLILQIWLNL